MGSISNGIYSVPMYLNAQQNVTLTAVSTEDPTKTAAATIALVPTVLVALSPTLTTLIGGQTTALNGNVFGTPNTAIMWSMSPQVGTLANGNYTAPSAVPSAESVTITATSQAVSAKSSSAVI